MEEHENNDKKAVAKRPVRPHPKPQMGSVNSLNHAIRQELWYVDTMVASPFRTVRRQLESSKSAWAQGADEAVWALEGMTRLPIKLLQSAFGETLGSSNKSGEELPASKQGIESR